MAGGAAVDFMAADRESVRVCEMRTQTVCHDVDWLLDRRAWAGLSAIAQVVAERCLADGVECVGTPATSSAPSSRPSASAAPVAPIGATKRAGQQRRRPSERRPDASRQAFRAPIR